MKRYILWLDYGCYEGWHPESFDTLPELYEHIKNGGTYSQPFEITEKLELFRGEVPA